jgi:hypothetical protein
MVQEQKKALEEKNAKASELARQVEKRDEIIGRFERIM